MRIKTLVEGLLFSLPAMILIYLGFEQGDSAIRWYLWSIALILGLPANVLLAALFMAGGVMVMSLADLFGLATFNAFIIPFYSLLAAGIVGPHVNAMLLVRSRRRRNLTDARDGTLPAAITR